MFRSMILGAFASLALALSPATPKAQANDWDDYWDDYYDRLEDQQERARDRYEDWLDRQRDAREDYRDWVEDQRDYQRRRGYYPYAGAPVYRSPAYLGNYPAYSGYYPSYGRSYYRNYRPGGFQFVGPRGRWFRVRW
jgi:hypothetical protein